MFHCVQDIWLHHCLAHRTHLVVKNAVEGRAGSTLHAQREAGCSNCAVVAYLINHINSFYKFSSKRTGSLWKFTTERMNMRKFTPQKIFETRWIASHFRASVIIYENFEPLYRHLMYISARESTQDNVFNDKVSKDKAKDLAGLLSYRQNFLLFLTFAFFVFLFLVFLLEIFSEINGEHVVLGGAPAPAG